MLRVQVYVTVVWPKAGLLCGWVALGYQAACFNHVRAWIDWDGDKIWSPPEQVIDETKQVWPNTAWASEQPDGIQGKMVYVRDVPVPQYAVSETWLRANVNACDLDWIDYPGVTCPTCFDCCVEPDGPCALGTKYYSPDYNPDPPPCPDGDCSTIWREGNVVDRIVRLDERLAVTSIGASGVETPIEDVTDPIWVTSMSAGQGCQLVEPSRNEPFAGGFRTDGPTLDVTVGSCPVDYSSEPHVEYEWTVINPAGGANTSGSGSFTGWNGGVPLILPEAVGKTTVQLVFDIFNDQDDLVAEDQQVSLDVFVGMNPAIVPVKSPKLSWLEKATAWAQGGSDPETIGSLLVGGIFNNGGWLYKDPEFTWKQVIDSTGVAANCFTLSEMWMNMMRVLGVAGAGVDPTWGSGGDGFVTKTAHRQSCDPDQAGNAHPPSAPIDRWMFGAHQVGTRNRHYYDPTFNHVFSVRNEFIEWNVIGPAAVDLHGMYLPLEGSYRIYPKHLGPPWGDWEYRSGTQAPRVKPSEQSAAAEIAAAFSGPLSWTEVDTDSNGQAEALRLQGTITVTAPPDSVGECSWVGDLVRDGNVVTSRAGAETMGFAGGYLGGIGAGEYPFSVDFSGEDIRATGVDGTCTASVTLIGVGGVVQDSLVVDSPSLGWNSFGETTARIASTADHGLDADGTGLFDSLVVEVSLEITATTDLGLSVIAFSPSGSPVDERGTNAVLAAGAHMLQVELDGRAIRAAGLDGPYELLIQISGGDGRSLDRGTFLTGSYAAEQFDLGILEPVGVAFDDTSDSDWDGLWDELHVMVYLTFRVEGEYQAWGRLSQGDSIVAYGTGTAFPGFPTSPALRTLEAEEQAEAPGAAYLSFRGSDIRGASLDGPYKVSLWATTADGEVVLEADSVHTTLAYAAGAFDAPPTPAVVPTGVYTCAAEDSTGDGLYDNLAFRTQALAADSGTVVASALLYTPSGRLVEWSSGSATVLGGVLTDVTIRFSGGKLRARGEDGAYSVRSLHLYHVEDPDLFSDVANPCLTVPLEAALFQAAPIVAGSVLTSPGTPLPDATVYLDPLADQITTDAQGRYSLAVPGSGGDSVTVAVHTVPMYPDSTWQIRVNGTIVGTGARIVVAPDSGQVLQVNFEKGPASEVPQEPRGPGARLSLSKPYPNPILGQREVKMTFSALVGAHIEVIVFDVCGRIVRRVLEGPITDAAGLLTWDARDEEGRPAPAGLYLVRATIRHGDSIQSASHKIVVCR